MESNERRYADRFYREPDTDPIAEAIAARDAEWVAVIDGLINRRKEEQKEHLLDALMCTHYGAGADALRELKARMTGGK